MKLKKKESTHLKCRGSSSHSPEEPIPALFDKPRIPHLLVPEKGLYYIVTIVARIGLSSIENTPLFGKFSHSFLILSRGC